MAIGATPTQCGNGPSAASSTSWTLTTTAAVDVGEIGVLRTASDNISSVDGDNNEIVSVTGGTGTWDKLSEYTNSQGAAAAGVTISAWVFTPSGSNAIGTVLTITLASARTQKVAALEKWTTGSGTSLRQTTEAAVVTSQVDAGGGFGASSYTGLTNLERLYLRVLGAEMSTTASVSPTSGFSALSTFRSSTSSPVSLLGEQRVATSTGETSNPSFTPVADKAGMFFALEEYTPSGGAITGTLSATLGAATLSSQGALTVQGSATATLGAATLSSTGALTIRGSTNTTLAAATLSATGGTVSSITGTLSATLGAVTASSAAKLTIRGSTNATLGAATLSGTGVLTVRGSTSATLGAAILSSTATQGPLPAITGTLSATLGAATLASEGSLRIAGGLTATLAGATLFAFGRGPTVEPASRRRAMQVEELPRGAMVVSTLPRNNMRVPEYPRREMVIKTL